MQIQVFTDILSACNELMVLRCPLHRCRMWMTADVSLVTCEAWRRSLEGYALTKDLSNRSGIILYGLITSSGWQDGSRCKSEWGNVCCSRCPGARETLCLQSWLFCFCLSDTKLGHKNRCNSNPKLHHCSWTRVQVSLMLQFYLGSSVSFPQEEHTVIWTCKGNILW